MMTGTETMSGPPKYGGGSDEPDSAWERVAIFSASIVVSDEESGPRGRDLLIAEPSTEKECPRRLVRTDYRASDPKTPVRIRARALQGETSVYDAESVRQFERNLSASCYAADPGCDFSRCNGQPRGRESSCHSTLVQGPELAGPFGGVS